MIPIPKVPTELIFSFNRSTPESVATTTSEEAMMVAFEASIFNDNPLKYKRLASKPVTTEFKIAQNRNLLFVKSSTCCHGFANIDIEIALNNNI